MTLQLGMVRPGSTIYIPFDTYAGSTGASVTLTGLAVTDIEVYKNGSVTQRASDTGYTLLDTDGIDFDGITGIHGFSIDLSSNATADFFTAGAFYWVVVSAVTIDSQTVNFTAATFSIGYPDATLNTTIASLTNQTSFTLTAGPAEDDALNGCVLIIHDIASAVQFGHAIVADYTGSTKTVTLVAGVTFTAAAGDNVSVFRPALQPTVWGRTLDVSSGGEAGVDWANVGTPGSTVSLSATTVATASAVTTVNGLAANTITAAAIATGAIDADAIADNAIDAGAIAANAITAAKIATDAIGAAQLAADAVTEIQSGLSTLNAAGVRSAVGLASANLDTQLDALPTAAEVADAVWDEDATGHQTQGTFGQAIGDPGADTDTIWALANTNLNATVGSRLASASYTAPLDAAATADAVWDATLADHLDSGSTGEALNAAGAAGDPWTTALPGAYGAGSAGNILGNRLVGTIATGTHNPQSGDAYARLGAPTGASVSADIADVEGKVDDLEGRLTSTRAGYLDNLSAGAVALQSSVDDLEGRLTATRAGYLDNLSAGAVALQSSVDSLEAGVTVTTNNDKTGYALTSGERTSIADALLTRDLSAPTGEPARSVLNALRFMRNRWTLVGATLTVYEEDDTTVAWTATVSTDAAADPVTGSDPS